MKEKYKISKKSETIYCIQIKLSLQRKISKWRINIDKKTKNEKTKDGTKRKGCFAQHVYIVSFDPRWWVKTAQMHYKEVTK